VNRDFLMSQVDQLRSIVDELESQNSKTDIYEIMNETIDESFWTIDLDLNFESTQLSIEKIIGYSEDELLGTSISEYLPEDSFGVFKRKLDEELRYIKEYPKKNLDYFERMVLSFKHKHKEMNIWCEVKIKFLLDEKNQPVSVFGTIKDVTEQKLIEESLYKKLDVSEKRYKEKLDETQLELDKVKKELTKTKLELEKLKQLNK